MNIRQWMENCRRDRYYFLIGNESGGNLYQCDYRGKVKLIGGPDIIKFDVGDYGSVFWLSSDGRVYNYDRYDIVMRQDFNLESTVKRVHQLSLGRSSLISGGQRRRLYLPYASATSIVDAPGMNSTHILMMPRDTGAESRWAAAHDYVRPIVDFVLREVSADDESDYYVDVVYLTIDGHYGSYTKDLDLNIFTAISDSNENVDLFELLYPDFPGVRIYDFHCGSGKISNQLALKVQEY